MADKKGKQRGRVKGKVAEDKAAYGDDWQTLSSAELGKEINKVEDRMFKAARDLNFEEAARLRDLLHNMKEKMIQNS